MNTFKTLRKRKITVFDVVLRFVVTIITEARTFGFQGFRLHLCLKVQSMFVKVNQSQNMNRGEIFRATEL